LAAAGRALGRDEAAVAAAAQASAGLPQSPGAGPGGDGRDLLRVANGLPVEGAAGDEDLLRVLGAPALPGVGGRRGVRGILARGPAGLRRAAGHRLDLVGPGRGDGQGAVGRGENRPQPDGSRQARGEALAADRWPWRAPRSDHRRGQPQRPQADAAHTRGHPGRAARTRPTGASGGRSGAC
jgi:hypothetical protein